jgi:coproporphyrinogen III oxidase
VGNKFRPENLGDWFYRRIVDWSKTLPNGHATTHVFRKTTLQLARRGEDVNRSVAQDACLSESVMMRNYVHEADEELRHKSNRTYSRIIASLPTKVAKRYGYAPTEREEIEERLQAAIAVKDWTAAEKWAGKLKQLPPESAES